MEIQLKRERCKHKVSTFLPDSVKKQLDDYRAAHENVKESEAVRYILALFLSADQNLIEAFLKQNSGKLHIEQSPKGK